MDNKPDSNLSNPKEKLQNPPGSVGGDQNIVGGDVGVGGNVGSGSVTADYIVGGDLTFNGKMSGEKTEFAETMIRLRDLIIQAYKNGELPEKVARKTLANLKETAELVTKEEKPPKSKIIQKLQYVADVLDAAVDMISSQGNIASVLVRAAPIAALLIKIATRIF
ncbi:MAG: hypothetical protein JXJ17_11845 [Anaerolineae bacterium]|nr:hypothetical protein [Anaerolineae bacterium]